MLRGLFRRGDSIEVGEAHRRLEAGELVLVDVREKGEWRGGRAPRARHVPLTTLPRQIDTLACEPRPVAFICRSGHRSAAACATARGHGVAAVNVRGGMSAWQRAGLPIVTG
jgi:rhodanese-related sulfurtransferase